MTDFGKKAIGAAQDAARMDRVVNFYARLPRGNAPEVKPTGLIGRYQARYFNKSGSAARKQAPCTLFSKMYKSFTNCP